MKIISPNVEILTPLDGHAVLKHIERHFFNLRTAPDAHPQMREVAKMLLKQMREMVPVVFDGCGSVAPSTVVNQYGANNTNITNAGNITINL